MIHRYRTRQEEMYDFKYAVLIRWRQTTGRLQLEMHVFALIDAYQLPIDRDHVSLVVYVLQ